MDFDSPCFILAEAIRRELCHGISVTTDILHHIVSVSGMDTLEGIRQTLMDENSSEGASLFELILFPDEGFQTAIEPLVEKCDFGKDDEKSIYELLISRKLETVLTFPGLGSMAVAIPSESIQAIIARLNIRQKTDPRIIEALRRVIDEPLRTRCKIRLRNSRWIQSETHIRMLREVIEKHIARRIDFIDSLDFFLAFLSDSHLESDMVQALRSEKERLIHLLDIADRQDHLLRTSPMEAIMLQGVRIISIDRDEIIRKIRILDQFLQ